MTKTEFRNNPDLVKQWGNELRTNELLRIALSVMEEESPVRQQPDATTETAANIAYGRLIGYSEYERQFRSLGEAEAQPKFLKATYGVPDQPEK